MDIYEKNWREFINADKAHCTMMNGTTPIPPPPNGNIVEVITWYLRTISGCDDIYIEFVDGKPSGKKYKGSSDMQSAKENNLINEKEESMDSNLTEDQINWINNTLEWMKLDGVDYQGGTDFTEPVNYDQAVSDIADWLNDIIVSRNYRISYRQLEQGIESGDMFQLSKPGGGRHSTMMTRNTICQWVFKQDGDFHNVVFKNDKLNYFDKADGQVEKCKLYEYMFGYRERFDRFLMVRDIRWPPLRYGRYKLLNFILSYLKHLGIKYDRESVVDALSRIECPPIDFDQDDRLVFQEWIDRITPSNRKPPVAINVELPIHQPSITAQDLFVWVGETIIKGEFGDRLVEALDASEAEMGNHEETLEEIREALMTMMLKAAPYFQCASWLRNDPNYQLYSEFMRMAGKVSKEGGV